MHPDTLAKVKAAVAFIKEFKERTECSPTLAEIGDHLGCGVTYAARLVKIAEEKGMVRHPYSARRNIEVLI